MNEDEWDITLEPPLVAARPGQHEDDVRLRILPPNTGSKCSRFEVCVGCNILRRLAWQAGDHVMVRGSRARRQMMISRVPAKTKDTITLSKYWAKSARGTGFIRINVGRFPEDVRAILANSVTTTHASTAFEVDSDNNLLFSFAPSEMTNPS